MHSAATPQSHTAMPQPRAPQPQRRQPGAQQLLDSAQRRLAALGDVDGAIREHHAEAYKAWATEGGERPALDVPAHLAERQRARDVAREEEAAAVEANIAKLPEILKREDNLSLSNPGEPAVGDHSRSRT
jgi:hypothetical protein